MIASLAAKAAAAASLEDLVDAMHAFQFLATTTSGPQQAPDSPGKGRDSPVAARRAMDRPKTSPRRVPQGSALAQAAAPAGEQPLACAWAACPHHARAGMAQGRAGGRPGCATSAPSDIGCGGTQRALALAANKAPAPMRVRAAAAAASHLHAAHRPHAPASPLTQQALSRTPGTAA